MNLFQFARVLRSGLILIVISLLQSGALAQRPGTLDTNFNFSEFTSGAVNALATTPSGEIVAGGSFTRSGNQRTLIRLTPSGVFDPAFNAGVTGRVDRIAVDSNNRALAVGSFLNVNGSTQDRFARFNPDGTHDLTSFVTTFVPNGVAALPGNRVLLAGTFFNPSREMVRLTSSLEDDYTAPTNAPNSLVEGFLVQPDGKVIVFGWFWMFDTKPAGRVLRLNADMSLDTNFNASVDSGIVECATLQADGKILIGGTFLSIGGVPQRRIARLNSNGTLDSAFSPDLNSSVTAITIDSNQRIYVSGVFTTVNGSLLERLARLHPNGNLDTGFDSGTGPDNTVNAVAIAADDNVLIGGAFTNYNGVPRMRIAKVFGGPSIPEAPSIIAQPTNASVLAGSSPRLSIRASGGPRLYYQWRFNGTDLPGETRGTLTLTNIMPEDAGSYSVTVSNELGVVQSDVVSVGVITVAPAILLQPTNVVRFVGQNASLVTVVTGAPPPFLRWYHNGNLLTNQSLATLTLTNVGFSHDGQYFLIANNILGSVTSGVANVSITVATNAGAIDNTFRPEHLPLPGSITNVTAAAIQPDGKILIARSSALNRLLENGSIDPGFANVGADDRIEALAVQGDGKILVGGAFRSLQGQGPRPGIARLQTNGMIDPLFASPLGSLRVQAIAVQADGTILCASATPSLTSGSFRVLSRLLPDGNTDLTFNTISGTAAFSSTAPQTNIYGLELQPDGKFIFDSSLGFQRLLPHGAADIGFNGSVAANLVDPPRVITLQKDGRILVGGARRGTNVACIFRLNADGTLDGSFNAGPTGARISAILAQPDGKIIIAGGFTNIQGEVRNGVARLAKDGTLDGAFNAGLGANAGTNAVVQKILRTPNGQLVLAGLFAQFNDYARPGVARLLTDPGSLPVIVTPPSAQSAHVGQFAQFSADVAGMSPVSAQWLFNGSPVGGATNLVLRIENVQPNHGGAYALTVSNSLGVVTSTPAALTVTAAPVSAGAVDIGFHPGAGPNGSVLAAVRQPDGKIVIGGRFTEIDGEPRNRIARLHADGTLDPTFPAGSGVTNTANAPIPTVRALVLQPDGKIIVGGTLGYVDGQLRASIARVNTDGSVDPSFADHLSGSDVHALFLQKDGKLVVGGRGSFSLGRLHVDGTVDGTFLRQGGGFGTWRAEGITELPGGKFLIAATDPADPASSGLMRLTASGYLDTTFQAVRSPVRSFVLMENAILIGGAFTNIHGVPRRYLAALSHDGALLSNTWSSVTLSDPVRRITRDVCGRVLVSGSFAMVNGQRHVGLARFVEDGTLDASFAPEFDGEINALIPQSDFRLLGAGEFAEVNGSSRRGVARILEDTPTLPLLVNQPTNQAIRAGTGLTLLSSADCAGRYAFQWQLNGVNIPGATNAILQYPNAKTDLRGDFRLVVTNVAGTVTSAVATVSISPPTTMPGDNDIDFFPQYTPTGGVYAIALEADGSLLVSGAYPDGGSLKRFYPDGSMDPVFDIGRAVQLSFPVPRLIALEPGGSMLICFNSGGTALVRFDAEGERIDSPFAWPNGLVHGLVVRRDGTIYLAGDFSTVNSYRSPGLARVSSAGALDTAFSSNLADGLRISAMTLTPDDSIIVARRFPEGDTVARFLSSGLLDQNFLSVNSSNSIRALALQSDGRILVAGDFTNFNGIARPHLVRLNTNGSFDSSFSSVLQPGDRICALAIQPDDKILICGTNTAGGPIADLGVLRLQRNGGLDPTFDPGEGATGPLTSLALSPSGSVYLAGRFDSYDGFVRPSLARAHGNPRSHGAALASNTFTLSLYTDLDRTYHLEARAGLNSSQWTTVQSVIGTGEVQTLRDVNAPGTGRFYRVRVE
jgi:large repetitive protein